jgi:23S rRNA G2069 N7-methylase RlmK/C1962 C5-methylase RlmI
VFEWYKTFKEAHKLRMQKSRMKTMLTAFSNNKNIIHREFVPEKQSVNGTFYKEVINRLLAHRIRLEFQESVSWYRLYDNAPAPFSGVVSDFFGETRDPRVITSTLLP